MKISSCCFNLTCFSGPKHKVNQVKVGEKATREVFGMEDLLGFVCKAVTARNGGEMNESPIQPFVGIFWGGVVYNFCFVFPNSPSYLEITLLGSPRSIGKNCLCHGAELLLCFPGLYIKAGNCGGKRPVCQNRLFCKKCC